MTGSRMEQEAEVAVRPIAITEEQRCRVGKFMMSHSTGYAHIEIFLNIDLLVTLHKQP